MKTFVAFLCVLLTAHTLVADIYSSALRQARNASGGGSPPQNNRPPPQSIPATPPANPTLQATLQNISALRADFVALGKLSEVKTDSPEKKSLLDDLTAAAQGTKPSATSVSKLADSLSEAIAGKKMTDAQYQKLAQDVHAIFNGSHLSQTQQETIFSNAQKTLQDGGVAPDQITDVINAIKAIAAETD